MDKINLLNIFEINNFYINRLLGSKSYYRNKFPENFICFNANIFTEEFGKVWFGDIDITRDKNILMKISKESGIHLYILYEMDGRFENEKNSKFKEMCVWNTKNGLSEKYFEFFNKKTLKLKK